MAVGPDGAALPAPASDAAGGADLAFVHALEAAVDRALARHPAGETFLYGIYQEMEEPTRRLLVERYRSAGWPEVQLREGLTGSHNLILIP